LHSVGGLFVQALHEEATPKSSFSNVVPLKQQLDAIAFNFEASCIHLKRRLMLVVVIFPEQTKPNFERGRKVTHKPPRAGYRLFTPICAASEVMNSWHYYLQFNCMSHFLHKNKHFQYAANYSTTDHIPQQQRKEH